MSGRKSSSRAAIPMVQAADLWDCDDSAAAGRFDLAFNRRVAIQRQVSPRFMVVHEVRGQDAPEMALVEHDDMTEALTTNGTDQSLHVRRLPG